jgi:hypothetical protein
LGALDGKRVSIKKSAPTSSYFFFFFFYYYYYYYHYYYYYYYYCYYKHFIVLLMAIVNSNYEFIMKNACINGRISDGSVLGKTAFGKALIDKLLQIAEPSTLPNSEKELSFVLLGMTPSH